MLVAIIFVAFIVSDKTLPKEPVEVAEPLIILPEPLRYRFESVTLVENEPLSVSKSLVLELKDALDSVIEPEPSKRVTLVE